MVCSLIRLIVFFFFSCALLFYEQKNMTKGIDKHTTKTKDTNLKNLIN